MESVSINGGAREVCSPMCFYDLPYFTRIGDEGDNPHWLPALAADQVTGFVDFPNPFRPAIAMEECGHFWTAK